MPATILLGAGGPTPGLMMYDVHSGRCTRLLSLPTRESVYAIGVAPEGTVAVGTRTGVLHWLQRTQDGDEDYHVCQTHALGVARAPVLAVTFTEEETIAVSDTAHRCLLWRLGEEAPFQALPTGGGTICGLFCLDRGQLAGLSTSGELVVWDLSNGRIDSRMTIPPVPALGALVKPVYWRARDAWVWPGAEGSIVFYGRRQQKVSAVAAHRGDVYAVMVHQEELLTIGRRDGCLQRWSKMRRPAATAKAPQGVMSATLWPRGRLADVVLVHEDGRARAYSWRDDQLEFVSDLVGEAFRVAVSPDMGAYESAVRQRRGRRAAGLAGQLKERIARGERSGLEPLYGELEVLGYRQVCLALRGEAARIADDVLAELKAYHELAGLLGAQEPAAESYLSRYAELLAEVWQPERAAALCRQLLQCRPQAGEYGNRAERLSTLADIIASEQGVIEAERPTAVLIEAALALGAELRGRYLLQNIGVPINCGVLISAGDLVQQYEQAPRGRSSVSLPRGEVQELWWLSRGEPYHVTMAVFRGDGSSPFSWLELGVKLFNVQLQSVLAPVVLLNAGGRRREVPVQEHNRWLLEELHRAQGQSLASGWLEAVYRSVKHAMRQAITLALAGRL